MKVLGVENVHSDGSDSVVTTNKKENKFSNFSTLPMTMLNWIEYHQDEMVTIWDANGKIIFISDSVGRLLGFDRCELIGTYWFDRLSTSDLSYIAQNDKNEEMEEKGFKIILTNKSGKYLTAECTVSKIVDNGQVYYISILKDITNREETEELMVRSEKLSIAGQLAAGIAHEIRNPLTSIKGFLQLLQAGVNRKEEYYKIMIEEIEKMEKITSELLYISKPSTNYKQLESVSDMIEDIYHLLYPQAKLKNIELVIKKNSNPKLFCDRSQIKQVIINLVKNAIEAMDYPGEITVEVKEKEKQIYIYVVDQGNGIPEEIIDKLGEPFFTTKENGTGLGIMISKKIIEEHDGRLEISQNKGKGSTFTLVFPNHL